MKRISALILVSLIVISSVSCGQSDSGTPTVTAAAPAADAAETAETTAADGGDQPLLSSLGEKDFGGETYTVLVSQQGSLPAFATELNGEIVNDSLYERDCAISEAYNVSIQYPQGVGGASAVTESVLAGDYICDLYMDALSDGRNYMSSTFWNGSLYNLL
ncbi:MAG: hypothetical protein K6D94_09725 [Clostridiales bacterium]|nr:hypothetical protein [Clostridiales bacterium]